MRKLSFLLPLIFILQISFAQTNMNTKYTAKWKTVEGFFKKGLNKSAQTEIESILKMAKAENNSEQTIKALCNMRVSMRDRDEKSRVNDIELFEKELKEAKFPVKQILHSILGDLYWTYYEENRWKILDRTTVENSNEEIRNSKNENQKLSTFEISASDLETWSADDFYNEAYKNYNLSLTESEKSKTISIATIAEILDKEKNTEKLRPTLYDFLVHRAIDYFKEEENELTKPAYAFEINDEKAFANASIFCKYNFANSVKLNEVEKVTKLSEVETDKKYQTLKLYQDVLNFHLNDKDPSALIDADLKRLEYINEFSILPNDNELYFNALKDIAKKYPTNEQAAMAKAIMAENYAEGTIDIGQNAYFNAEETPDKINYIEAKKLCDAIIEKFPNSEASSKAEAILQKIEMGNLAISTETVVVPNQASLAKISFKNIKTIYCKAVKITSKEYKGSNQDYDNDLHVIVSRNGIKNWTVQLPNATDYKEHTTEIKIDDLPLGIYAIVVAEDENFSLQKHYSIAYVYVSNLAYVYGTESKNNGTEVYVVNRTTGEPQKSVQVKTWTTNYDYNTRKYITKQGPSFTTDENGFFSMNKVAKNENAYSLELIKGDDDLYLNDNIYVSEYNAQKNIDYPRTFLFTDRSIYRPSQKIYFKGIMIMTHGNDSKNYEIVANRKTQVTLKDVNYQDVKTIEVTTNEYGSFTGEFTAPEGLLTGQFQIVAEAGQTYISIEEYKRPKFEVTYDTIKGTYKLNDDVKIKGLAKAFAGNNIDGATVKYRVVRNARFPYYWCFYKWGQPSSAEMEITHGTTTTKADGSFDIAFKAIPDASIDKKSMPVFDYEIIADVTDLNGETRSGTTNVSVSYQSLVVKIDAEEKIEINDFNAIKVFTSNLSGTHIPSQVTLTLKKLVSPTETYRARLWGKIDMPLMTEKEFHTLFPLDEYNEENNKLNWKEEKTVWTKTFSSTEKGIEYLQKTGTGYGWYVLEAKAFDKDKNEVVDKKYIRLMSKNEVLPSEHLVMTSTKSKVEPSETANIQVATPYDKVFMMYSSSFNKQNSTWISLSKSKKVEFQIKEEHRGGFNVNTWYIKNNRFYQSAEFIDVPWTNKELKISLETFRDKMLPGSDQEWTLKITGEKKEKVSAELLATMYDASLDAFKPHSFNDFGLYSSNNSNAINWFTASNFQEELGRQFYFGGMRIVHPYEKEYRSLNWFGLKRNISIGGTRHSGTKYLMDGMMLESDAPPVMMAKSAVADERGEAKVYVKPQVKFTPPEVSAITKPDTSSQTPQISLRSNFNETAFFFPQLHTDAEGNILLKFKAPDALTRWKMMAFAHTKNIESASFESTSVTQKELMIVPNTPRFFREGDKMVYSAKVTNLAENELQGNSKLEITNSKGEDVNVLFKNNIPSKSFTIKKGESTSIVWEIEIPQGFTEPVIVKTTASSNSSKGGEQFSDGEQNVVPVLLNSMLVTETLPLPVKPNTTKKFQFTNLLNSQNSQTLKHYNLAIEYTANPAWYAIQSLPYLTEYPYECAEQTFNRYYANAIATHIANSNPKIKEIFSTWQEKDTLPLLGGARGGSLLSNLSKNQELKSALLQETPWVLEAKSEEEQKRNIATLFNMNRMSKELERCVQELEMMQTSNGGFTWFKGMPEDRFMTQYILTGIGKLMHIDISEVGSERRIQNIIAKAIPYLDARIKEDYDELKKYKSDLTKQQIGSFQVQYLYMRSFFKEIPVASTCKTAFDFYKTQAGKFWLNNGKYLQAMSALALHRWDDKTNAQAIIKSLRENAIHNEELGMYYKDLVSSYRWYEAPIEAQAMLIEAFKEVAVDENVVDELKIWLLKNKQTTNWKTTKATADACYALLLNGTYWLAAQPEVNITVGNKIIDSKTQKQEVGTGYFKTNIPQEEIKAEMGNISVKVSDSNPPFGGKGAVGTTWGAVYWQYFENLDKIPAQETGLKLKKQLYKISNSDKGEVLIPLSFGEGKGEASPLNVGDKVKVRIELRVDRPMEYVHMKDMRGACFEPINVLSNYKYQGGLGYYEATKDMATNFFFHYLQKGTYVFEYPMFVTNKGDFSNGIATIQCMYAPEFSSHSEGIRVKVK